MILLPSILSMGASLFTLLTSFQGADENSLLPMDEKVHIREFQNGVTAYVHKNDSNEQSSKVRVVVKQGAEKEVYEFAFSSENLSGLEHFFKECKEKIGQEIDDKCSLAIIAVGNVSQEAVADLAEKHFASFSAPASYISLESPCRVQSSPNENMLGLRIHYHGPKQSLRNFNDLRCKWNEALSQQILQNRLQDIMKVKMDWELPEQEGGFLPSDPFTATFYCPVEELIEMTDLIIAEIEQIKERGIREEEFARAKSSYLNRLSDLHLQTDLPDSLLISYHEDLFSHAPLHPSFEAFVSASLLILPEISSDEVGACLQCSLKQRERSLDVLLPNELIAVTEENIQEALTPFFISVVNQEASAPSEMMERDLYPETTLTPVTWDPLKGDKDPYDSLPLTSEEKRIIDRIFTTMAKKNVVQLAFVKNEMERNGKKINHIHPMKMLGTLFSDARLKDCMKKIRKSSFKWNGFLDGLVGRLKEEYKKENLLKYAPGLAKLLGVNADKVKRYLKDQEWEDLVIYLLENT